MTIDIFYIFLGALGFGAYEVGIRIVDEDTGWMNRIGIFKYLTYLLIFGSAVSVVAGGISSAIIVSQNLSFAAAVLLGMGLPSSIRVFAEVFTRLVLKKVKKRVDPNLEKLESKEKIKSKMRVEEHRKLSPQYLEMGYILGDIFGFKSKM